MKNNENGRSMVEMIGVLAIIGMLSVGGIWGLSEAIERHKLNRATAQITAIFQAVSAHLYDNYAEPEESFSLIPYYKYKTPALFDDMPIVKMEVEPYEFLQDAFQSHIGIYIHPKPVNNQTVVWIRSVLFSNINTGVSYCRNVLSAVQPVYKENPEKFIHIRIYANSEEVYVYPQYDFANMSIAEMINICYDTLINGKGETGFRMGFAILFNNKKF